MDDLVRAQGNDVFLDQHFNSVGNRLKKAEGTNAIRAVPILHPAENFSFQDGDEREESQKHSEKQGNVQQAGNNLNQPIWRATVQEGEQPLFRVDENLIERIAHAW